MRRSGLVNAAVGVVLLAKGQALAQERHGPGRLPTLDVAQAEPVHDPERARVAGAEPRLEQRQRFLVERHGQGQGERVAEPGADQLPRPHARVERAAEHPRGKGHIAWQPDP